MNDTWTAHNRSVRRAEIAQHVELARDRIFNGPQLLSAFPARRRPILTQIGGFVFMAIAAVVWATIMFWTWKLLGVDASGFWFSSIQTAALVLIVLPAAWGTRGVLATAADGSLVIAHSSLLRWSRGVAIEAVVASDRQIAIEADPPWWRVAKVDVDGDAWYLSQHLEPERFAHWVLLRPQLALAISDKTQVGS